MKFQKLKSAAKGAKCVAVLSGLLLAASTNFAWAQPFPSKPITMIVPYPAGGGADALARAIQPTMAKVLGQPVIIENLAGVGGALGVQRVLSAPADGYTVLVGSPNEVVLAPLAMASVKYKTEDLRMLAPISNNPLVIMARKDLQANNTDELIALGKREGAQAISFGSIGYGSMYHMVAEYFGQQTGMNLLHVPYKGTAPLIQDLAAQQIDITFLPNVGSPTQLLETNRIKAVAVANDKRMPNLKSTPTTTESKEIKGFVHSVWAAVLVRADVPDAQARTLLKAVQEGIQSPEVAKVLESSGVQAVPSQSLDESARFLKAETAKFNTMAKSIKLTPQ